MNRRGSVLIHVLMTGVVVAVIAAGLMRMTMLRYVASARATSGGAARKQADAALNRALTSWNTSNIVCSAVAGYTCSPTYATTPGTCDCTCTPTVATEATIVVTGGGPPPCNVAITSAGP
jgi:Tfp pilus assembly protein PilX